MNGANVFAALLKIVSGMSTKAGVELLGILKIILNFIKSELIIRQLDLIAAHKVS